MHMGEVDRIAPPAEVGPGSAVWLRPDLLLCLAPHVQTEASVRAYYDRVGEALDVGSGPYVMITDTRHIGDLPDARVRRLHARLATETERHHRRRCIHSITVVEGPALRAVLTAVKWFIGDSGVSSEVVGSFAEAIRIAESKL